MTRRKGGSCLSSGPSPGQIFARKFTELGSKWRLTLSWNLVNVAYVHFEIWIHKICGVSTVICLGLITLVSQNVMRCQLFWTSPSFKQREAHFSVQCKIYAYSKKNSRESILFTWPVSPMAPPHYEAIPIFIAYGKVRNVQHLIV